MADIRDGRHLAMTSLARPMRHHFAMQTSKETSCGHTIYPITLTVIAFILATLYGGAQSAHPPWPREDKKRLVWIIFIQG